MDSWCIYLEVDLGEVPDERAGDQIGGLLAPDAGDADDPPLGPRLGEGVEVELLGPGGVPLLGLLDEPLLHFLPPVVGRPALPPLVPELPPLPRRQGLGAGWRLESRGDRRRRRRRRRRGPSGDPGYTDWRAEEEGGGEGGAEVVARTPLEKSLLHFLLWILDRM